MNNKALIKDIIRKSNITTLYQPIVNISEISVWGWEALTRGPSICPLHSPIALFRAAEEAGMVKNLEKVCVENAALCFGQLQLEGKLFVNLSPEVLIAGSRIKERVKAMIERHEVPAANVVIELTEHSTSANMDELIEAIHFFRQQGFEIAIDDLGAGYSSLRLWSEVKPDYVKIDRHFITNIDTDITKQEFVRSILAIAKSVGSKVIAEGVETYDEFEVLKGIGIELIQGYLIQRPELSPESPSLEHFERRSNLNMDKVSIARDIISMSESIDADTSIHALVKLFQKQVSLTSVAVVQNDLPIGMIHRTRFLTEMSKPYAIDLAINKPISTVMDTGFLQLDSNFRLEQVSRLVTGRARIHAEEDFIITQDGKFLGIAHVIDLLRQITEIQVNTARHANPLTMLPGNVPIGDCVNDLLQRQEEFTVCYFDLDNFKPFNDYYGYAKGDQVLVILAELMKKFLHNEKDFIGHIGGDDFIAVTQKSDWKESVSAVVREFEVRIKTFYSEKDQEQGGIDAIDRYGEQRMFDFVSLSIGAMTVPISKYHSFHEISSELVRLKHQAKSHKNISIVLSEGDKSIYLTNSGEQYISPVEEAVS